MDTEEISIGIEQLVDHLRANQSTSVNLGDIAGVTEVLLATMRRYFNSVDTTLYTEFRDLSEYIQRARSEISELRPNDLKQEKIPRAGLELEAIVAATENATGAIMDAAEEIMSADPAAEEFGDTLNDACMRIFEACSFQDITGQRITKVVATLTYIEERLHGLQDAWGPDIADAEGDVADQDAAPDSDLLNGPALAGEGIQQNQVDDLLAGNPVAEEAVAIEPEMVPEVESQLAMAEPLDRAENRAEPEAEANRNGIDILSSGSEIMDPAPPAPKTMAKKATAKVRDAKPDEPQLDDIVPLKADPSDTASQDEIDALFD
ncbi:MAG: protein phosphatase CheZ [Proteobacteria bacterium]|nr:protein phosphatase CheZ [Pseudomonadota bacterium]